MAAAKSKILPLESLRGLAAIVVVLFHCTYGSVLTENAFVQAGPLMVDFFFVLSGFVIALNYMDRIRDAAGLVAFQTRRFWRLYPLHLFTLLGFLAIEYLKFAMQAQAGADAGSPAFSSNDLTAFVHNLFLTQGLFLDRVSFNYPSWSISTEFYTYLIFALVMLTGRMRLVLCAALALAGWGVLAVFDPQWSEVSLRVFRCLYAFFLGVLGCAFMRRYAPAVPGIAVTMLFAASLAAIGLMSGGPYHSFVPLIFLATVCGFAGASEHSRIVRLMSLRPLVYLGTISYSLYMVHAGVWWVSNQLLRFVFKVPSHETEAGQTILALGPVAAVLVTLLGLAAIIGLAHITYHQIERRFQRSAERGGARSPARAGVRAA